MSHKNYPASEYPKDLAKPTTPDETQTLSKKPVYSTCYKGSLTKSEIYERMLPDKVSTALRIDGPYPGGGFMCLQSSGAILIVTGEKNKEKGPGSGKLCIHSNGQQNRHDHRSEIKYDAGDDEDGIALGIEAIGDIVVKATGSEVEIKALKILISATEELILKGDTDVIIQAGSNGGGTIQMFAGSIEQTSDSTTENIYGQKMTYGVSEETTVQFDPRASVNKISAGHINHKILGDYKVTVGGVEHHVIAGLPKVPALVKAGRKNSFSVGSAVGGIAMTSIEPKTGSIIMSTGGEAKFTSGILGTTFTSAGPTKMTSATGNIDILATAGNVNIKGLFIYLN